MNIAVEKSLKYKQEEKNELFFSSCFSLKVQTEPSLVAYAKPDPSHLLKDYTPAALSVCPEVFGQPVHSR